MILGTYTQGPCPTPDPGTAGYALDCIPSNGPSHSIGTVRSAPDGTLFLGSGDSSDYGSVDSLAFRTYNENSYAGKIANGAGLLVGDVGWNEREEIDLVSAPGKSYGWPCYEGGQRTPGYDSEARCSSIYAQEGTAAAQVAPDHEWRHGEWQFPPDWTGPKEIGRTALGGPTYTGSSYPSEYRELPSTATSRPGPSAG